MTSSNHTLILTEVVKELSDSKSYQGLFHQHNDGEPLPSAKVLKNIIELARSVIFPGYFGNSTINSQTISYHIGVNLEKVFNLLTEQIQAGLCFSHTSEDKDENKCREKASSLAAKFISKYRIDHELLLLGVPLIPRIITEMAHSETGIDIHPGAKIGDHFTIAHGTGVVIGATSIIGNNVKLYQGVTLGAKSFPLDDDGNPIKGIPRHPIIANNVVIYSNATILGRITIGEGATVGGNIWVTEDVEPDARIVQKK